MITYKYKNFIIEKSCILSNILRDEKITNDKLNKDTNKTLINTEIEINVENHICQESEKNPILCQESNIDNSNIKNTELPSNTPLVENSLTVNIKISKLEQDEEYCHINFIYPEVYTSQSQNTSTSRTVKSIRENVCYDSDETTITESLSNVSLKQLNLQEIDEEKRVETDNFPSTILEEYEYVSFVPSLLTDKKTSSLTTFYSVTENLQELLKNTDHEVQRSRVDSVTLTEKSTLSSISSLEFVHNFDSCYSQEFIPHVIDIHLHNPYKSLDTDIVIDTIRNIQLQSTFKTPKLKEKSLDESYSVISEINQFFELSFDPQKLESSFTILDKIVDDEISVKTISDMMLFPDSLSITSTTTTYNAPKFLKTLSPNSIVFENEAVILRVSFSGIPLPHITWYCNGNILLNNSICTILCEDGVSLLRISDSNILNNDDYITCQIDNAAGSEYSETKIRKLKNETRICNVNLKNINDYQGISISLLESDKANMIRDIDKSLSLELEVIENGDHNLLGGEVSLKNFYFERPIFIQELPKQIFCLENENINFKCIFKGFPEPVVTWKKNGYLLSDSSKLNIICEDGITILKLYNLIEFDSGVYECQINNGLGIEKCQCHVTIERNVKNTSTVAIEIRCCKEPQESYLGILVDEKLLNERINGNADKKNFIGFRFTEAILLNEDDTQSISSSHESLDDGNDESSPIFVTKLPEMKKITKGESIDFKVLFIGEPIPDIRWEYDSNTIKGNITKTIEDGVAIFTADNIQSDLILTCIAQNRNGTERCSCKIVLKSKADGETNNLEIGNSFNFIDIEGNVEKEVNEVMLSNKNNAAQHP
uniref:Ig-like domain-containing protein n=1 Tax=Strongyloides venezuelensis TaxID=75913 RepID=A0A0K0FDN1_STRVS